MADPILETGKDQPKTTGFMATQGGLGTCAACGATRGNLSKSCPQCGDRAMTLERAQGLGVVLAVSFVGFLFCCLLGAVMK